MSATHPYPDRTFRLEVEPERDVVRVCPHGEVDIATSGRIREKFDELRALGFDRVALDLRGVSFLDSTGVRLALDLRESSRAEAWDLAVIEGPADVQRVFELTGVRALLPFVEPARIRYAHWGRA